MGAFDCFVEMRAVVGTKSLGIIFSPSLLSTDNLMWQTSKRGSVNPVTFSPVTPRLLDDG